MILGMKSGLIVLKHESQKMPPKYYPIFSVKLQCAVLGSNHLTNFLLNNFRYEERIDRVETRITARLRDQLGTAKNAAEMFRIFSRFNALFVRPHIRGAIREYQTQLIQRVKDDIEALHEKFKIQYPQSKAYKMSGVRDLPPVAGSIIWARQIDRQLRYDFEQNSTKIVSVLISHTLNLISNHTSCRQ